MPQFDPTYFISQVFWLFVFGVVLYWGLSKYALPNVAKAFALRFEKIEGRRREAELMRLDAEKLKNSIESDLSEARKQANDMVNMALQENSVENAHHRNEFLALLKERIAAAEESIKIRKQKILDDIPAIALETSIQIAEKLSGKAVGETEALKYFDKALKDYKSANDDTKKVNHA